MKKKVLLVEDDVSICLMLKTLLELEGFEVYASFGDLKGIPEFISNNHPDFLIVDYHLKNATALDILKSLNASKMEGRPFTLITSGEDQRERCFEAGADGFILKPYMPDELIDWLHAKERALGKD